LRRKIIIKNKKKHHKKGHAAPSGLAAAAVASALPVTQHGNGEVPVLIKDNSRDSREEEEQNGAVAFLFGASKALSSCHFR